MRCRTIPCRISRARPGNCPTGAAGLWPSRSCTHDVRCPTSARRWIGVSASCRRRLRRTRGCGIGSTWSQSASIRRSCCGVVRQRTPHCLEAALTAAIILEQHGYPPLVLSCESIDELEHVIFVYRRGRRWGSVARSRDPGLHGRKAVFPTARALALSYVEPYVDYSGRVKAYTVVDLRALLGTYDWRLSDHNVWKAERMLLDAPHRPITSSDARYRELKRKYAEFRRTHEDRKPLYYKNRDTWSALPKGNW